MPSIADQMKTITEKKSYESPNYESAQTLKNSTEILCEPYYVSDSIETSPNPLHDEHERTDQMSNEHLTRQVYKDAPEQTVSKSTSSNFLNDIRNSQV
jgi:hypothetical protein